MTKPEAKLQQQGKEKLQQIRRRMENMSADTRERLKQGKRALQEGSATREGQKAGRWSHTSGTDIRDRKCGSRISVVSRKGLTSRHSLDLCRCVN